MPTHSQNSYFYRYGGHLAIPLMREAMQKWGTSMTKEQCRETLDNCMRVLWYRDCRAINKVTISPNVIVFLFSLVDSRC